MGLNLKSTSSKILASAALLAAAAGVAGMGTYGAFTASTSASAAVDAATVNLAGAEPLNIQAAKIIPGDTIQRAIKLVNGGTLDLTAITLTTSADTANALTTDKTNGLQLQIDSCPVAWSGTGAGPYTCVSQGVPTSGTTILSKRSVLLAPNFALTGLASTGSGKTDYLRVTLNLPETANNDFQGLNSSVTFAFNGAVRGVTNK
jgi:spore coat-associated protein N